MNLYVLNCFQVNFLWFIWILIHWLSRIFLNYFRVSIILINSRSVDVYSVCAGASLWGRTQLAIFLWYYRPKFFLWGICVDPELFPEVWIRKDRIFSNETFHLIEGLFLEFRAFEFCVWCCDIFQRYKSMCISRQHILVVANNSHGHLHLFCRFWRL